MSSHEHSISPLRQRMIEDMTLRKLAPKTQSGYLRWVKRLNGFLKRSPATATAEDLRRFQLDLVERSVGRGSINAAVTATLREVTSPLERLTLSDRSRT